MIKIGIVGHGFVGKAVNYAFNTAKVEFTIADPRIGTSVEDIAANNCDVVFVAVPTPMGDCGVIDGSIVYSVVSELMHKTSTLIVLKSTVTPEIISSITMMDNHDRFVYNPEFLTEANANQDFVNATFHVIGGSANNFDKLVKVYKNYSRCVHFNFHHVSVTEASFIKYTINTFLATKVTFFNQLYDTVAKWDCSYDTIAKVVSQDPRIGKSHMQVPGPDDRRGYGGACFPKDTTAFYNFARTGDGETGLTLLKKAIDINTQYRVQYALDEREKEQNVKFGDV